jgi:hypothetical protein|tara:strand:- start:2057 stop:2191 length:135 start_codon:yes stop_codon:yes gene_type:complete
MVKNLKYDPRSIFLARTQGDFLEEMREAYRNWRRECGYFAQDKV